MLKERNIDEEWVLQTIRAPEKKHSGADGNMHYFRFLAEHTDHALHVIVNETVEPNRIITLFFDRRERKTK